MNRTAKWCALGSLVCVLFTGCQATAPGGGMVEASSRAYQPVVNEGLVLPTLLLRELALVDSRSPWASGGSWETGSRNDEALGAIRPSFGRRSVGSIDFDDRQYSLDGRFHNTLRVESEAKIYLHE